MSIEFPYFRFSVSDKFRPYIPISIRYKRYSINTIALLDSGSDNTIIPLFLAEKVCLNLSAQKITNISSIGREMDVYKTHANIIFYLENNHEFTLKKVPVFVPTNSEYSNTILGRESIFNEFLITFDEYNKKVIFDRRYH
jgi:hypothetical protein